MVTSIAHEALFGCNHLGCIATMPVASYIPFPFSAPFDDMLAMLICATRWLESLHACIHVHAWVLLASVSSIPQHNEAMDIQSNVVPCRHHLLFIFLLGVPFHLFASFHAMLAMSIMLIYFIPLSHALCIFSFHCLSAGFLSLPLHVHIWSKDAWSLGTVSQAQAKRARTQACRYEPSGCKQLF